MYFLNIKQAPPIRILILGPRGSGKSTHARYFAEKFGLFHIKFRDRLQELIMKKTTKKIGPEYDEPEEEELPDPESVHIYIDL